MKTYLLLLFVAVVTIEKGSSLPVKRKHEVGYAEAGTENGRHYANTGFSRLESDVGRHDIFYVKSNADGNRLSTGVEVGFLDQKAGMENSLGASTKILTAGLDVGVGVYGGRGFQGGLMGRASLIDQTIHFGPVDANWGVAVDTGTKVDETGVEAKFLGIGGKIGKGGVQACFIFCFGINW